MTKKAANIDPTYVIDGCVIEYDGSGVGHHWVLATADNCPSNIAQEIACEIIDGKRTTCDDYLASNGLHYRW